MRLLWSISLTSPTGATIQAELIAKKLVESGIEVYFLHFPMSDLPISQSVIDTYRDPPVVYPFEGFSETVEAVDPDVVVLHTIDPTILPELERVRANYPVATRIGLNLLEVSMFPNLSPLLPNFIRIILSSDVVICSGKNVMEQMKGLGVPEERLYYIPTAIDPSAYQLSEGRDPTILVMGRLSPVKNLLTALEAFNLLKRKLPEAEMAIAGMGDPKPLNAIIEAMELEDCKYVGYFPDPNLLFKEVSILLLPSLSENLPQSVLEAYACGVPCVISDCGWSREFLAPVKVPPDAPDQIAKSLLRLLEDRDYWREVRERQLKELSRYDINEVIPKYISLFEDLKEAGRYFSHQDEDVKRRLRELGVRVREHRGGESR